MIYAIAILVVLAVLIVGYAITKGMPSGTYENANYDMDALEHVPDLEPANDTITVVEPLPEIIIPEPEKMPTMAQFEIAHQITARHEGGYQRSPDDRGNYNSRNELVGTNWGIAAFVYEKFLGRPPSTSDMRNMTKITAKGIYKRMFWDRMRGDRIHDQQVANLFYDGVVNHGRGIILMQEVIGVAADGVVGIDTLAAINSKDPEMVFNAYRARRRRYYHQLVGWFPSNKTFLKGWLRRIDSFQYVPLRGSLPTATVTAQRPGNSSSGTLAAIAIAVAIYTFS